MSEYSEERMRFLLKMGIEIVFPKLNRNSREEWEDNEMFNGGQDAFRALLQLVISFFSSESDSLGEIMPLSIRRRVERRNFFSLFFYKSMSLLR